MSFTTLINYDSSANFIYDSSKIDFVGGVAKLNTANNPNQSFSQDFSSSVGFTFNASKSEFNAGILRQKFQRPSGIATMYSSFTNNENASWGDGNLTGVLENGASVSGGQLDLTGGGARRVVYDATVKLTSDPQRGTIRVHYRPNYTGNPAANQTIFHVLKTAVDFSNQIELYHDTASAFRMNLKNSANGSIVAGIGFSSLSMTAGQLYVIEFNYDFTGGAQRLFVNGNQQGATLSYAYTRDSNQAHLQLGNDSGNTNFKVDDFIIFNSVIHTAAHTGDLPYTYQETDYLSDAITLPQFSYTFPENIVTFTSLLITSSAFERWTINGGSGEYYFDGSNWVVSNGTYAQASTSAQMINNLASFPVSNNITFKIYTASSNNQATIDLLQLNYTGRKYDTSDPFITTNAGIYIDALSFFDSVNSIPALTGIQFILNVDNVDKYFDGANWVDSNGSYSQSNSIAQIQAQYTSFSSFVALGVLFKVKVLLRSNTGLSTPEITSHTFTYDFFGVPPVEINECIVYSFIEDILQDIPDFTSLNAKLYVENTSLINQGGKLFVPFKNSVNYNTVGYAEISVINTVESQKKLSFSIEYIGSDNLVKTVKLPSKVIPDQVSINLATLLQT
jgi:hypothetical protein